MLVDASARKLWAESGALAGACRLNFVGFIILILRDPAVEGRVTH